MKRVLSCAFLCILFIATVSAAIIVPTYTYQPAQTVSPTPTMTIGVEPHEYVTIQPNATPTSYYGVLIITSEPRGAFIWLNGSRNTNFRTPLVSTMWHPAEWTFVLKYPGYEDYTKTIVVQSGKESVISATLVPLPEPTASATVTQTPAIPTTAIPTTQPATLSVESIPTSTPEVTQQFQGQPTSTGSAVLSSDSTGSLSVTTTPAGAEVSIDNEVKGISPTMISGISPGGHALKITKAGYQDFSTTITIEAGRVREYSTGLAEAGSGTTTIPATSASNAPAKSPGFVVVTAIAAVFCLALAWNRSR